MMKAKYIIPVVFTLLVTSCAPEWLEDQEVQAVPESVTISRHTLTMLVGDTCRLSAIFLPADFAEQGVMWSSTIDSIVHLDADRLTAEHEGNCQVIVTSVMGTLSDTCDVRVLPQWGEVKPDLYDMVLYATLPFGDGEGQVAGTADDVEVAAFCRNELRGRGEYRESHGVQYTVMRIYSGLLSSDALEMPVTFRLHHKREGWVEEYPDTIMFDGEAHGTISDLYPLRLTQ